MPRPAGWPLSADGRPRPLVAVCVSVFPWPSVHSWGLVLGQKWRPYNGVTGSEGQMGSSHLGHPRTLALQDGSSTFPLCPARSASDPLPRGPRGGRQPRLVGGSKLGVSPKRLRGAEPTLCSSVQRVACEGAIGGPWGTVLGAPGDSCALSSDAGSRGVHKTRPQTLHCSEERGGVSLPRVTAWPGVLGRRSVEALPRTQP